MHHQGEESQGLTRRSFLIGAGATIAAGAVAGCTSAGDDAAPAEAAGETAAKQWSWETPPAPISDDQITKTVTADVVVVGAGISGVPAAAIAAEMGATVQLIEKQGTICPTRPTGFSCFGSKLLKEQGVMCTEAEKEALIKDMWGGANATSKQELLRVWANESGAYADWLVPIVEGGGIKVTVGGFYGYYAHATTLEEAQAMMRESPNLHDSYWTFYPLQHQFGSAPVPGVSMWAGPQDVDWLTPVYNYATSKGAVCDFETTAVQLVREAGWETDPSKRVTAVIATDRDGNYVKYEAAKGVILATGGFDWNDEMIEAFYPIGFKGCRTWQTWFQGEGHKMAWWAGAKKSEQYTSHIMGTAATAQSMMSESRMMPPEAKAHVVPWREWNLPSTAMAPCLWVNNKGDRFINEETGYFMSFEPIATQPDSMYWGVWDSEWKTKVLPHKMDRLMDANDSDERMAANVEAGMAIKADTIDDLIAQMGVVDGEKFKKTLENYNAMCAAGKDNEFLKPAEYLTTIDKPPFYAAQMGGSWMTTCGGVEIDKEFHVLDENLEAIPGLYAGGNPAGGFYGNIYAPQVPMSLSGHSMTFSWLAAKNVVNGI